MTLPENKWDILIGAILEEKRRFSEPLAEPPSRMHYDLAEAIRDLKARDITAIVGEIKPGSPSEGILRETIDVPGLVEDMESADVAGISILTETRFFGGSKAMLSEAAGRAKVPLLMKDFLTREEEAEEGRRLGADAVLLIVRLLGEGLRTLYEKALDLGLTPLVEVHGREDMRLAAELEPEIIGINNRDLSDLTVDLDTTIKLSKHAPQGSLVISESGYSSRQQIERMEKHCDAFLVGSALMKGNVREKILELQGRRA